MDTKKRLIYLIIGPVLFAIASVALKGQSEDQVRWRLVHCFGWYSGG